MGNGETKHEKKEIKETKKEAGAVPLSLALLARTFFVNIICLIWPSDSRFQKGTESLEVEWSRGSNSLAHFIISSPIQIPRGSYPFILKRWNSKKRVRSTLEDFIWTRTSNKNEFHKPHFFKIIS